MKKFINFFAYVAAVVFGVMTMTSCSNDDDEIEPADTAYTWKVELGTKDDNVAQNALFRKMQEAMEKSAVKNLDEMKNKAEAEAAWKKYTTGEELEEMMTSLDQMARQFSDPTLYCTLTILRNGKVWKTQTWITTYDPATDVKEHVYKFKTEFNSDNEQVRNSETFKQLTSRIKDEVEDVQLLYFDEQTALAEWERQIVQHSEDFQGMVDVLAEFCNDPTISITVHLLCDDDVMRSLTWTTTYKSEEEPTPDTEEHLYTYDYVLATHNEAVAEDSRFKLAATMMKAGALGDMNPTSDPAEAQKSWEELNEESVSAQFQSSLDDIAEMFDDPTMYCTCSILLDGEVWHEKTWTTTYTGK